ncbi:fimbrial major subunit CsuA/B family protein [Parapusillimonas sp. SGNA-6]|nr:fimbrial major subunit CsuA/B family protein [Parapusillimonas sp. SGNA-6]
MKKSLKVLIVAAAAGVALSQTAAAETVTQQFQVKLVVKASCTFGTSLGTLDLGNHATNANNVEQVGNLRVQCTSGATPIIKMSSSDSTWKLKDGKGGEVGYQILNPQGNVWDTNNGYTYTANGGEEQIAVKAKVANAGNKAGTFTDMVTVSVDF